MTKTKNAIAAAAFVLAATGSVSAEGSLNLYNWGDYINPEILQAFTDETGIEVTLDTYSSNDELLAKLQAGASGYDIVFPSVYMVDIMHQLGLLHQTDINQHPDFANIDPTSLRSQQDPDGAFCLPYAWGSVGYFHNAAETGPLTTWEEFFAIPETSGGKITLLDDMREVMSVGLMMTGASINSADAGEIQAATDYILAQSENVTAFTYDVAALITSGDISAGQFFVGLAAVTSEIDGIEYVIPTEGATMYQEDMCVLANAPNKESAQKFMEFYLRPEVAAMNVNQQFNGTANIPARALVSDVIRNDPNITVSDETMARLHILEDVGAAMRLYDRAWNTIRTAQ